MRRIIRRREVCELFGFSRSALVAAIKRGEFVAPIKLFSRSVGWLEEDLEAWRESRIANSRPGQGGE